MFPFLSRLPLPIMSDNNQEHLQHAADEKEKNLVNVMCEIRRNEKTNSQGGLEEVLQSREKIYGNLLDPTKLSHGSDLDVKLQSMQERSMARSMLAGAPLMVAQMGAQKLRRKMLEGDPGVLRNLQLNTPTTLAQVLEKFRKAPPLDILKLCNKEMGAFILENLVQHSDDLDYTQDVLNATGSYSELTPTLHAVLAGFNRRRISGSFKHGHQSIIMDRLRFSHLASANDNDDGNCHRRKRRRKIVISRPCHYYQQSSGCRNRGGCRFDHICILCGSQSHGEFSCKERGQRKGFSKERRKYNPPKRDDQGRNSDSGISRRSH